MNYPFQKGPHTFLSLLQASGLECQLGQGNFFGKVSLLHRISKRHQLWNLHVFMIFS